MPKEAYIVAFNARNYNPGFDSLAAVKKSTTATTLPAQEPLKGLRGQVFGCLLTEVEAESITEACEIVKKAYGGDVGASATNVGTSLSGSNFAVLKGSGEWKSI